MITQMSVKMATKTITITIIYCFISTHYLKHYRIQTLQINIDERERRVERERVCVCVGEIEICEALVTTVHVLTDIDTGKRQFHTHSTKIDIISK